jgi:hypothetical protein
MIGHPWYSQFDAKLPLDQGPYGSSVGYASTHMIDCLTDDQAERLYREAAVVKPVSDPAADEGMYIRAALDAMRKPYDREND